MKRSEIERFMKSHRNEILAAVEEDDNTGFCISCGEQAFGVEPDARGYICEACDEPTVYSAEELLLYIT